MKKTVNGVTYDPDVAERKATWYKDIGYGLRAEELYRNQSGEYFLVDDGDKPRKSARIIPLTDEAAQEWAAKKLDATQYVKLFGQGQKRLYTFLLSYSTIIKIEENAEKADISPSAYLESLIP